MICGPKDCGLIELGSIVPGMDGSGRWQMLNVACAEYIIRSGSFPPRRAGDFNLKRVSPNNNQREGKIKAKGKLELVDTINEQSDNHDARPPAWCNATPTKYSNRNI